MTVNIYTIYDNVAEEAGPIFEAKNDGTARRAFKRMIEDPTKFTGDPEEFVIICLGSYNKETANVFGLENTRVINKNYGKSEEEGVPF